MSISVGLSPWWVACVRHAAKMEMHEWSRWLLEHPSIEVCYVA